jgi:beta-lactamase class A
MNIFGRKKTELDEDQIAEIEERILSNKKIRDLKSQNAKERKEPIKPWGKKERFLVLAVLLSTILVSVGLTLFSNGFSFSKISLDLNLNGIFKGETIVITKKSGSEEEEREAVIFKEFTRMTGNLSGNYALYLLDLKTNRSFGIEENKIMQAASLIKLPLMLYVQDKVDYAKIEAMGKRSDNGVFNKLVDQFGEEKVQEYIFGLGMANTSISENKTTPKETGDLLKKIYDENNQKIIDSITETIFENWIVAGIPDEIMVAHKFGREEGVVNDAGIIFGSKPFVLVIMSDKVLTREADAVFPELAKMIYSAYEEN